MPSEVVITGASGFLGEELVAAARSRWPAARVVAIGSPRSGGVDLLSGDSPRRLERLAALTRPADAILIHAAADIEWQSERAALTNPTMAYHVAAWAKRVGVGYGLFVSSVSVLPVLPAGADSGAPPGLAPSAYGRGKLASEWIWSLAFPESGNGIVRLAGLLGWQKNPTLFFNRLLLAAAQGASPGGAPVVQRRRSARNPLAVSDAAALLLDAAERRLPGLHLAAGRDTFETGDFVDELGKMPGSRLKVVWKDDGGADAQVFPASPSLRHPALPWRETLRVLWASRPGWAEAAA